MAEKRAPGKRLVRVCAWCKKVRGEDGLWGEVLPAPPVDAVTHGICPECLKIEAPRGPKGR